MEPPFRAPLRCQPTAQSSRKPILASRKGGDSIQAGKYLYPPREPVTRVFTSSNAASPDSGREHENRREGAISTPLKPNR